MTDKTLTEAIIQVESGGDEKAVSRAGAKGLMQLMPGTLKQPGFGIKPAKDDSSEENVRIGSEYANAMIERYDDVALGLMAYNWGPGNVDKWVKAGAAPEKVPAETRKYVPKVLGLMGEEVSSYPLTTLGQQMWTVGKDSFTVRDYLKEGAEIAAGLIINAEPIMRQAIDTTKQKLLAGADVVVEGLDKAEEELREGIAKAGERIQQGLDTTVEGLDRAEAVTRQAMDATLAKADTAVEGLDRAEAALRDRLSMITTQEPSQPVPSLTDEEKDLTQGQLTTLFGETAKPAVPTSITIPGRERAFPQREQEAEAEVPTSITIPGRERAFPQTAKEVRRSLVTPPEEPQTIQEAVIKQEKVKPIPYDLKPIKRVPYDFGYRLTAEDIQKSPSLLEYRAYPGDIFHENKLYRVYSSEPSKTATPEEAEKIEAIEQLRYGFDRYGNTIEENIADYLQTIVPLDRIATESDPYADVFAEADSDTRRDMIAAERTRDLIEEYGYKTVFSPPTGLAITGGIAGSLLSPTTVIPLGGSVKSGALIGAALAGGYAASADLAQRGEVRALPTASAAILGGVLTGGLVALTRPSQVISPSLLKDKNGKLLNSSDIPNRLVKLQKEGKITPQQVKASHDYYIVSKPIAEAEKKITRQGPLSRVVSPIVDRYLGTFTSTMKKYSSMLAQRVRTGEVNAHIQIGDALKSLSPFITRLNSLDKSLADDIAYRLALGKFDEVKNALPSGAGAEIDDIRKLLTNLDNELKKAGQTYETVENYFPRLVKDYDGFKEATGSLKLEKDIDKQIQAYADITGRAVADLSDDTVTDITDKYIRGLIPVKRSGGGVNFIPIPKGKAGIFKQRTADEILEQQKDLMQYYASPAEALQNYVLKAVSDIERRKVLGIYGKKNKAKAGKDVIEDSEGFLDMDASLGALIQKERAKGDWSIDDEKEIVELLRGYFVGGNQSPGSVTRFLRAAGYAGTIANPISAITQLGDLGMSAAMYGFRNTIAAMVGEKNIKLVDNGLKSLAEFDDPKRNGAFLEKMFKYSGFATIDRIGKETTMGAALRKAQQLSKSPQGREQLRKKYGEVFGDEFDNFIADLQRKDITQNVRYYALNELADVQPIFLSELPRAYIENPNGRILYMLKSYTLKAYDVVRNQVIDEYAKGNKAQALKKAAALAAYLSLANAGTSMTKDFLLGRDVKPEQIPDRALWGLLGVFGANQYVSERYLSRGDLTGFAKNLITPATPLLDEAFKLGGDIVGGDLEEDFFKYAKPVPIVGNIAYNWLGGGAEAWNERNK